MRKLFKEEHQQRNQIISRIDEEQNRLKSGIQGKQAKGGSGDASRKQNDKNSQKSKKQANNHGLLGFDDDFDPIEHRDYSPPTVFDFETGQHFN